MDCYNKSGQSIPCDFIEGNLFRTSSLYSLQMINMLLAKATDQGNEIARLQDCERLCVELSHNIQEMEAKCLASLQKTEVSAWLPLNSTYLSLMTG